MVDVAYIGGAGEAREERLEILALQKLSTMERASAEAHVTVLDGGDMSDADLDAAVAERAARDDMRARKAAATRVEFFTMVRGDTE